MQTLEFVFNPDAVLMHFLTLMQNLEFVFNPDAVLMHFLKLVRMSLTQNGTKERSVATSGSQCVEDHIHCQRTPKVRGTVNHIYCQHTPKVVGTVNHTYCQHSGVQDSRAYHT